MVGASVGGGFSKSSNKSSSEEKIFKPQHEALNTLYGRGKKTYTKAAELNDPFREFGMNTVNPYMQSLNPYMMQGFGGLMGGGQQGGFAQQMSPQLQQSLQQSLNGPQQPTNTQRMYSDIIGGSGNTYIDPVIDDMYDNAWQGLDRGGFRDNAQSASRFGGGGMGNSRRQLDNTLLASENMNNVRQQENFLRAGAHDADLNWKMDIAQGADTNASNERMAAQQGLMGQMGAGDQNTQFGLNSGNMMQSMGMGMMNPWMAMQQMPWNNVNNYANTIGAPIVLGSSKSSGNSFGIDGEVGAGM